MPSSDWTASTAMPKSRYIRCNDIKEGYYEPKEYQPISVWGYIGYELLFSIPVIGWIVCIVKAIGSKNKNVLNFARTSGGCNRVCRP